MKKSELKEQLRAAKIAAELANKVNDWYVEINWRQLNRAAAYEKQISAWCEEIEAELEDERNVNASLTEMYHNEREKYARLLSEKKFDGFLIAKLQEHVKTISDAYEKTLEQEKTDADMIAELQERVKTISAAYDKTINILNIEFERRPRRPW